MRPSPAIVTMHHRRNDEAHFVCLSGEPRQRKRLPPLRGQRAVDESYIAEAHELSGSLAADPPRRPDRKRRRLQAEAQDNVRRLVGYGSVDMSRNRCGGVLGEIGNPPGIPSALLRVL